MYVKKKSVEGYFSNSLVLRAWSKGKALAAETVNSIVLAPDGRYEAKVVDAGFNVVQARGISYFIFELPGGEIVRKAIAVDSADGIARLLLDLAHFDIFLSGPVDLEVAYDRIRQKQPPTIITIETRDGLRNIVIEGKIVVPNAKKRIMPPPKTPEPQPEVKVRVSPPPPPPPPPPDPVPAAIEETSAAPSEADIKPGDMILVRIKEVEVKATVLKEFPDDYELAIALEDGTKMIVSGNDVVAMA